MHQVLSYQQMNFMYFQINLHHFTNQFQILMNIHQLLCL